MNKNPTKFKDDATVEMKTEKCKKTLSILITENKNTQPLLSLDWLDKLEIGLQRNKTRMSSNIEADGRREKIINEHDDLLKNNHTIMDFTIEPSETKF